RRHTRFSRDWSSDVCSSDLRPNTVQNCRFCRKDRKIFPIQKSHRQSNRIWKIWLYRMLCVRKDQGCVHHVVHAAGKLSLVCTAAKSPRSVISEKDRRSTVCSKTKTTACTVMMYGIGEDPS